MVNIVKQSVEILDPTGREDAVYRLANIERAARNCYQSDNFGDPVRFVEMLLGKKHFSMLEFAEMTVQFKTDIGIGRELLRHRHLVAAQESTRFCKYDECLNVIKPLDICDGTEAFNSWLCSVETAHASYRQMREDGVQAESARSVLPLCTATKIIVRANLRSWMHIINLRLKSGSHPDMRMLMAELSDKASELFPIVFDKDWGDD